MQLIIFTDLDGTLLDHDGYSIAGAREALEKIRRLNIPLIFATSKTRAEVEDLFRVLSLSHPFIVENGGGLFFPAFQGGLDLSGLEACGLYRMRRFGISYDEVRSFVSGCGTGFGVRGFGDMEIEELATLTGLSMRQAELAKKREFTEPFVCSGPVEEFRRLAEANGLAVTEGGRFYHLMGSGQDKGRAVRETVDIWRGSMGRVRTVGLGDSPNDEPLLANVDIPVLVPRPDGSFADIKLHGMRRASLPGSSGWGVIVSELLDAWDAKTGLFRLTSATAEVDHG